MTEPSILFDLTEFLHDGQRSGIQRVCYEMVAHWPASSRLVPACVDRRSRLVALAPEALDLYRAFFQATKDELPRLRDQFRLAAGRSAEVITARKLSRYRGLLNATVFALPHQVEYYLWAAQRGLAERIFLFVHDMLPWLQPELFTPGFGVNLAGYLKCLRQLLNLSFNSVQTRSDTLLRVLRDGRGEGPVFPLGADCLGTSAPSFDPSRRRFSVIGTVEPRKNHCAVLDAFERIWADGVDVELAFAGKLGWLSTEETQRVSTLRQTEPRFQWFDSLGDDEMAEVITDSRATIYPAFSEGYGLPPVESLALGVPVIVTATIPSISMLPAEGQWRLPMPTAELIRQGVLAMLDDQVAHRKTQEIRGLSLPRWSTMTNGIERWVESGSAMIESASAKPACSRVA
jgi:glycosyltransferase involved in cell wall biosynthesis